MSIEHYIFYHNRANIDNIKPRNLTEVNLVNLDNLVIPEQLIDPRISKTDNRAIYSEYLGILSIKPQAELTGCYTYSIPYKFNSKYAKLTNLPQLFLPELTFDKIVNANYDLNTLYYAEYSSWNNPYVNEIDTSLMGVKGNSKSGPFKGTFIIDTEIFYKLQRWLMEATSYLFKKYGFNCGAAPSNLNMHKYYQQQTEYDTKYRMGIAHILERLVAYYLGRKYHTSVRLSDYCSKI